MVNDEWRMANNTVTETRVLTGLDLGWFLFLFFLFLVSFFFSAGVGGKKLKQLLDSYFIHAMRQEGGRLGFSLLASLSPSSAFDPQLSIILDPTVASQSRHTLVALPH